MPSFPIIKVRNDVPDISVKNYTPDVKSTLNLNQAPTSIIQNFIPNVKTSIGTTLVETVGSTDFGGAGYPLGVLMAITYRATQTSPSFSKSTPILGGPTVRII